MTAPLLVMVLPHDGGPRDPLLLVMVMVLMVLVMVMVLPHDGGPRAPPTFLRNVFHHFLPKAPGG